MGTIVQEYGPIYGEVVNGTVQGRPNGSVYVPSTNTVSMSLIANYRYCKYHNATQLVLCDSSGNPNSGGPYQFRLSAQAQDLSSNIQTQIYTDAECTTLAAHTDLNAGNFNTVSRFIRDAIAGLTDGQQLYARAQLMNNSVPVATSDVIPITMVVPE